MDSACNETAARWQPAGCPFQIEVVPRALEAVRLVVQEAFFAIPRGGAEVGGLLIGGRGEDRISITGTIPFDCEHATGPSFVLSDRDRSGLRAAIDSMAARPGGADVLGWYHSHTRSEIFLSPADLAIHDEFFPEPWQVALVLRPHVIGPVQAQFFYREAAGTMCADASHPGFTIAAENVAPVPLSGQPARLRRTVASLPMTLPGDPVVLPRPAPVVEPPPGDLEGAYPVPFAYSALDSRNSRGLVRNWWALCVVAAGIAAGVLGGAMSYQTRILWLPALASLLHMEEAPTPLPASFGLAARDDAGRLRISWDQTLPLVRRAESGLLEVREDGDPAPFVKPLDARSLSNGSFIYVHRKPKVSFRLTISDGHGARMSEISSFEASPAVSRPAPPVEAPAAAAARRRATAVNRAAPVRQSRHPKPRRAGEKASPATN
jgi:proteasome lid subunit RPN8/RPN11